MRCTSAAIALVFATVWARGCHGRALCRHRLSPSTGRSGTSWNFGSQNEAETEAYYQCGVEDCDTVLWFTQCGAIAVGDGYGYGTGYASSLNTATNTALQYCDGYTSNCQISAAFCNDGY